MEEKGFTSKGIPRNQGGRKTVWIKGKFCIKRRKWEWEVSRREYKSLRRAPRQSYRESEYSAFSHLLIKGEREVFLGGNNREREAALSQQKVWGKRGLIKIIALLRCGREERKR